MSEAQKPFAEFEFDPKVRSAEVSAADRLVTFWLSDGRRISAPLHWFPRLLYANADQKANWRVSGGGYGVHWPDVDEDISIRSLFGRPT